MERLDFSNNTDYSNIEACIHLNRYSMAKPYCKDAKVLDAACGQGYGSYLMKSWGAREVYGLDISEDAICQAKKTFKEEGLNYIQHTVESLPYEDNFFDLVVSLETMEHLDDVESFLSEIKRVLKPNGVVILSCPNDNYYYQNDVQKNPYHKRTYTFFEFREITEKYLGICRDFYLAFALDGFVNIPFEHRTEPERPYIHDALSMLQYIKCDEVSYVPQERFLNNWNCNYYMGIWGNKNQGHSYVATISPRETFIDHKDIDYDLLRHLNETEESKAKLKNELSNANNEIQKLITTKQQLQEELSNANSEIQELTTTKQQLQEELSNANSEIQELTTSKQQLQDELSNANNEIQELTTTKQELQDELSSTINKMDKSTEFNKQIESLQFELMSKDIIQKRLNMLLDLTTKERDYSRETIVKKDDYIHELEAGIAESRQNIVKKDEYIHELEACLADSRQKYDAIVARLNSLESSRGVKLLQKWYMLRHRKKKH